jgi:hypothetical protein
VGVFACVTSCDQVLSEEIWLYVEALSAPTATHICLERGTADLVLACYPWLRSSARQGIRLAMQSHYLLQQCSFVQHFTIAFRVLVLPPDPLPPWLTDPAKSEARSS